MAASDDGHPEDFTAGEGAITNPVVPPGPILTLSPEEISRFFVRARRDRDAEGWDVRLDATLKEILERANDFVPSESGGILLDDPRAKLAGSPAPRLTFIAAYGPRASRQIGRRIPSDRGFVGQVYRSGAPRQADRVPLDDPLYVPADAKEVRSMDSVIGVPVIVGESICGVLEIANRRSSSPYTPRDQELLRIFAAYMSSSIQNALDAIRAQALARLDDLTGLFNSRHFHTRLADEVARADHDGTELSVLFLDLDNFKRVNDRFGHVAGSWTLREVARLLTTHAPAASILARYGGDEFVIILPGSDLGRALQTADNLRRVIREATFFDSAAEPGQATLPLPSVTASVGVASYRDHLAPGGGQRRRESALLRLSDTAMYRAKAKGRDRTEAAEPEE